MTMTAPAPVLILYGLSPANATAILKAIRKDAITYAKLWIVPNLDPEERGDNPDTAPSLSFHRGSITASYKYKAELVVLDFKSCKSNCEAPTAHEAILASIDYLAGEYDQLAKSLASAAPHPWHPDRNEPDRASRCRERVKRLRAFRESFMLDTPVLPGT